ncbi:MAG: cation-transporting P-type ATPase [Betaproteobacteria bacterium]|nr:cation-transporting P-type ATPase [Betaproteobacteria bacterium]
MKIHRLSAEDALASLRSRREGLSRAEAAARLREYGENRVERLARPPWYRLLAKEFSHLFAIILWLAAGLAFFSEWREPGQGMAALGWAVLGVIAVNGLFSFWQEYRAEAVLAKLEALLPQAVTVLREGERQRLPASRLVPGDVVLLREGDEVPADCRVVEAFGVRANMAAVTGESLPKGRDAEPSTADSLLDAKNVLLAGTSILAGEALAVAFATGRHTEFGRIARLSQSADERRSPLYLEIARLSRWIGLLAALLGAVFFAVGQAIGQPFWASLIFAIGIIVANVPEGLLPTVTLSLAMAARRMARRRALVRHLPAVETLGGATVILSDKTGTLTQNRMAVERLYLAGREGAPQALAPLLRQAFAAVVDIAGHCHSLEWLAGERRFSGDPMEKALVALADGLAPERPRYARRDEVPFEMERRRMATLHATPTGLRLYGKGALEAMLPLCDRMQTEAGIVPLTPAERERLLAAEASLAEQGLRVLALAWREVAEGEAKTGWEAGLILAGLVGLADPPRPDVPQAMATCKAAGIRVFMVTGDHPRTALAVARQIGLVDSAQPLLMTGPELRRLSPTQLQLALDAPEAVFARLSADQKLTLVQALQAKGHIVAVTGDGVNDAPALRAADIGVAMGRSGTDVAREAADLVLLDDHFATIVAAIEEGRAVYQNLRKFLTYILTSNIPEVVPYLAFVLFKIPLPLTVIQILAVDLGTDMLPALALGAEPPHPGLMREPPRRRGERLLSWGLIQRAYLFLGLLEAAAAMAAFFHVLERGGWHAGQVLAWDDPLYLEATTATLAAIVVMQMVNVFLCRDPRQSVFRLGWLGNRLIYLGLAAELIMILVIAYTDAGNRVFGTAPLDLGVWLYLLPFAGAVLLLEEARKAVVRKR